MDTPLVTPVPARSAVLSLLLGTDPPSLNGRQIVAAMAVVGIAESTVRVALTRMVTAGDLSRSDSVYTLTERLAQRRLDAIPPRRREWGGAWELAVVTTTGRSAGDRAALRKDMQRQRVAELREGVWTRPANLRRRWPESLLRISSCFEARPLEPSRDLAARLWNLAAWADRGRAYLDLLDDASDEPARFRTMVAAVRHLQTDPMLPAELLPDDWPEAELSTRYADYRSWLSDIR